jgi:hypothetical protein
MIGYGPLHVRYATGREVDWFVVGLAGRKHGLALHVMPPSDGSPMPEIRRELGDLDEDAVVALVRAAERARSTWV